MTGKERYEPPRVFTSNEWGRFRGTVAAYVHLDGGMRPETLREVVRDLGYLGISRVGLVLGEGHEGLLDAAARELAGQGLPFTVTVRPGIDAAALGPVRGKAEGLTIIAADDGQGLDEDMIFLNGRDFPLNVIVEGAGFDEHRLRELAGSAAAAGAVSLKLSVPSEEQLDIEVLEGVAALAEKLGSEFEGMEVRTNILDAGGARAHPCRVYACFGSRCHLRRTREPRSLHIRSDGYVMPIHPGMDERYAICKATETRLRQAMPEFMNGEGADRLFNLCGEVFKKHVAENEKAYLQWNRLLAEESKGGGG